MNSHIRNSTSFAFCSILFLASGNMAIAQSCPDAPSCTTPARLIPPPPTAFKTGESVDIEGEYAVVGSSDMRCATVDRLQCGAAHVYRRVNNQWTLHTRLVPNDEIDLWGEYAESVAIEGDYIFVSSRMDDHGGGPNQNYGAVYVFKRTGTQWSQSAKILPNAPIIGGSFGYPVAADGDRLVTGGSGYDCVNDDVCGAAFVYRRIGDSWVLEQQLASDDLHTGSSFGHSIAISGTAIAIGAHRLVNIPGDALTGAVFVFRLNGGVWTEENRFYGQGHLHEFGVAIALENDRLVVLADGHDCAAGDDCGQAFLFEKVNDSWHFQYPLIPLQSQPSDYLGRVAMEGELILLGSTHHDCAAGSMCGIVYVFRQIDGVFEQVARMHGPEENGVERFGRSIAINLGRIMIRAENVLQHPGDFNYSGATYFVDASSFGCDCDAVSCTVSFEAHVDCDENARIDECEMEGRDCNGNNQFDACDVRFGNSLDSDLNNIPDECACLSVAPIAAEVSGINKNRFLSFSPGNPGHDKAIRVTLRSLHHVVPPYNGGPTLPFTSFEGEVRWVGPPDLRMEHSTGGTFLAAQLQCDPHFQDWSAYEILHVTGSAIVPSSEYDVQIVGANCNLADEGSYSPALLVRTTRWCDVEIPLDPPSGTTQPDLADVSALINKFRNAPGAPIKARALLAGDDAFGNITSIDPDLNFTHISVTVDAFRGRPYPYAIQACP